MDRRQEQAHSFGAQAAAYDRGRPSYPAEAVRRLLPAGARRVLDLGAGTGKFTAVLAGFDLDIVAVEPLPGMREQFRLALPGVEILDGNAEAVPLPDHSVDLVCCAQAWHWVDPARAVPEMARVLRPGGRLGLVWNIRVENDGWESDLGALLARYDGTRADLGPLRVGPPFGPARRFDIAWTAELTMTALRDMVASRSYVITLPVRQRSDLFAELDGLLATHPELAGRAQVSMRYRTACWVYDLPPTDGVAGRSVESSSRNPER